MSQEERQEGFNLRLENRVKILEIEMESILKNNKSLISILEKLIIK